VNVLRPLAALALATPLLLVATPAYAACDVNVQLPNYSPAVKSVPAGTTVTWCWTGDSHTVTFDDGPTSPQQDTGATYTRTFTTSGTYAYHCKVHSSMKGSVTVPGATTAPPHTTAPPTTRPPAKTTAPTTRPPTTTAAPTTPARTTPPVTTAPPTTTTPPTTPPTTAPVVASPSAAPTIAIDPPPAKPKTGVAVLAGLLVAAGALGGAGWLLLRHR
jgi:plastocyanin